ncbi:uncharacterized protein LOC115999729 isoform X1 [Ipomoea triloba]|uniref:uncharacterized protein LOC115999729 isoform X1 n=1 Tax=Ipomoea triloba TaxID=35885 RepID=UPI00125E8784|nr:uncharacterized protein LOC115999729 isoform X1 [Ipomoea triloba]XP_031095484.1 uncharacterized protein LOC115999729 isoform X1 [Ipomoea triloba]XP_031095485.1 uncharacterized protein LOC115999729 isoform X1 [Ipomoea triloba]
MNSEPAITFNYFAKSPPLSYPAARKMAVVWCYTYTLPSQSKMAHGIHCCSMNRRKPEKLQTQAPKLLKIAVSAATQLLSLLSPPHKHRLDELTGEGGNIELSVSDVDDVLTIIKDDYEREYFVTGLFTSAIYAEDCTFEDPTIKFRGRDLYSRNLKLLVPFFDTPSIKLEKIEKGANSNADFIMATWKLRTYLKLPWKPLISVNGCTVYDLDRQLRVVRHVESWDISALEAIGQIFTPGFQREEPRGNTYGNGGNAYGNWVAVL